MADDSNTVMQNPATIRNLAAERRAERDTDATRARELIEQALTIGGRERQTHGPDRLIAAAQVYATLALRA